MILVLTALFHGRQSIGGIKNTMPKTGGPFWNSQGIFIPRRKKFKGYMRSQSTFNKNR
jgi:hypothetical protein